MYWDLCKRISFLQDQVQLADWSKGSIVGWYFGIVQGSGKISYTCNRLLLINGFLEVVT